MSEIKVNPLPSRTWHWLRMNESAVDAAIPAESCIVSLRGAEGLHWERNTSFQADMETGMGAEFSEAMSEAEKVLLEAPAGFSAEHPAVLTCGAGAGVVYLHAERESALSVIVLLSGHGDAAAVQIKACADAGAKIRLCFVSMPEDGLCLTDIGCVCAERAELELTELNLGGAQQFSGIAAQLRGNESRIRTDMGYRVQADQKLDINYVVRHEGRETVSSMNAWAILENGARKLFRGTIDFATGCSGSKGSEKEDVLLLGENQINQTIPLILCQEEDVEGDHGATISRLDEQVLFYLGSRGIDAKTAEEMVAQARLEAVCAKIPDEEVRNRVRAFVFWGRRGSETDAKL